MFPMYQPKPVRMEKRSHSHTNKAKIQPAEEDGTPWRKVTKKTLDLQDRLMPLPCGKLSWEYIRR